MEMTTMKKCKVCDSELIPIGAKLVCSNENCTYQEYGHKKSWFKLFAEDDRIWSQLNQCQLPSVVAIQYERLRSLLQADELYGVQIKIKDIYETEVKFLVLVILSDTFNDDAKKKLFAPYIYLLMNSNPSLGTWLYLANELYKLGKDDNNPIYRILDSLIEYDNKEQIVAWRNANIGHGVLMPEDAQFFQDSLKEKVESLVSNYIENLVLYSEIRLCTKINEELVDIDNQVVLENTSEDTTELFILVQDKVYKLIPLIQCYKSSVYFFDSYIVKKSMTKYLSSSTNDKCTVLEKKLSDMFSSVKTIPSIEALEDNADDGLFLEGQVKRIDEIVAPSVFFRYDFIKKCINDWIRRYDNGNFLVEMKAGMGKTTFVKMVDQLSYNNFQIMDNTLCRAFYINSIYGYSKEYFINSITKSLLTTNSGEYITGDLAQINLESVNACNELANNINYIFRYYQKRMGVHKLIIFIDGLDEIPYSTNSTIADIIPSPDSLDKGIYFIFTSRLATDDVSTFTNNKVLAKLEFEDRLIVEPKTEVFGEYKDNLLKSITKNQSLPISIGERLIGLSNVNALELQYLLNLYRDLGTDIFDTIDESIGFIDFYWKSIKTLFGETYYTELLNLVKLLVFIPVPISSNNIAELLGESNVTFKLHAFLNTLKHWINSKRTGKNTLLQITRPEVIEWVDTIAADYGELLEIWKRHLDTYIGVELILLSVDELRILSIELLAVLKFDAKAFRDKYSNLLPLYLVQLNSYMHMIEELDYSLHRAIFHKIDELINNKIISLEPNLEICTYLDFGKILKEVGFIDDITLNVRHYVDQLSNQQKKKSAGFIWNLYQLIAQCYDLQGNQRDSQKYFALANSIQKEETYLKNKTKCQEYSLGDEYSSLYIQLQTAISHKNNARDTKALSVLQSIEKQCKVLKDYAGRDKSKKFDELLINCYLVYVNLYKKMDVDKALSYLQLAEKVSAQIGTFKVFEKSFSRLIILGQIYRKKGEYDRALEYYDLVQKILDSDTEKDKYIKPVDVANVYNSIANIYRDKKDYNAAVTFYTKGIDYLEAVEKRGIVIDKRSYLLMINNRVEVLNLLKKGKLYQMNMDCASAFEKSLTNKKTEKPLKRSLSDKDTYSFELAKSLFIKSDEESQSVNPFSELIEQGKEYWEKGEYNLALECYIKAKNFIGKSIGGVNIINSMDIVNLYNDIGMIYRDKGDYKTAITVYTEGIDEFEKARRNGDKIDRHLYVLLINNRRAMFYKLGIKDLFEEDSINLYKHYNDIDWQRINSNKAKLSDNSSISLTDVCTRKDYWNINYNLLSSKENYRNQSHITELIDKKNFNEAIHILKTIIAEDLPTLKCLDDLAYCYGEIGCENKSIELYLLIIVLCNYNYDIISKRVPNNSLISLSHLGIKGDYELAITEENNIGIIDKNNQIRIIPGPNLDQGLCSILGYNIPCYFRRLGLFSLSIVFYELGCFSIRKIISNTQMPLFPHLVIADEKNSRLRPLKEWFNMILENQKLDTDKSLYFYTLATRFYKNEVSEAERMKYLKKLKVIRMDYVLTGVLDLLPNMYIALELALRAMQYGSKDGKNLVIQIYSDKEFDGYDKSLVKYIERLNYKFNR